MRPLLERLTNKNVSPGAWVARRPKMVDLPQKGRPNKCHPSWPPGGSKRSTFLRKVDHQLSCASLTISCPWPKDSVTDAPPPQQEKPCRAEIREATAAVTKEAEAVTLGAARATTAAATPAAMLDHVTPTSFVVMDPAAATWRRRTLLQARRPRLQPSRCLQRLPAPAS